MFLKSTGNEDWLWMNDFLHYPFLGWTRIRAAWTERRRCESVQAYRVNCPTPVRKGRTPINFLFFCSKSLRPTFVTTIPLDTKQAPQVPVRGNWWDLTHLKETENAAVQSKYSIQPFSGPCTVLLVRECKRAVRYLDWWALYYCWLYYYEALYWWKINVL